MRLTFDIVPPIVIFVKQRIIMNSWSCLTLSPLVHLLSICLSLLAASPQDLTQRLLAARHHCKLDLALQVCRTETRHSLHVGTIFNNVLTL